MRRVPTTEEKPEVPFSRVLKRDPQLVLGTTFERFCDWYLTFGCPKHGPGRARDQAKNVYLFVCLFFFFVSAFFEQVDAICAGISHKNHSKNGVLPGILNPTRSFSVLHLRSRSVVGTLLKLRLRRHLPRGFILVSLSTSRLSHFTFSSL